MVTPFQLAWDLLKTEINTKPHPSDYPALRYMNHSTPPTPTLRRQQKDEQAVRDFVNRQPQKPNFGIPMQTEQTRLPIPPSPKMLSDFTHRRQLSQEDTNKRLTEDENKPYKRGSSPWIVNEEQNMQRAERRLKDQQEAAKLHLRDNPPRLERDEEISADGNLYNIMSGYEDLGSVGVTDRGDVGYGEIKPAYRRQGLYGKTLQAIINERNVLHSTGNRNQNSQPFHEQFNPPNTGKHVTGYLGGNHLPHDNGTDRHTYRALPPEETPENWGALEYDTGALPIYQQKPVEPTLNPRDREQASLARWGYIPGDARYN